MTRAHAARQCTAGSLDSMSASATAMQASSTSDAATVLAAPLLTGMPAGACGPSAHEASGWMPTWSISVSSGVRYLAEHRTRQHVCDWDIVCTYTRLWLSWPLHTIKPCFPEHSASTSGV